MFCISFVAHADELSDASKALCEKQEQCAMHSAELRNLPENMRAMMQKSIMNMCHNIEQETMHQITTHHELYQPALACIQSRLKLSCTNIETKTPSCLNYEKLAKPYLSK